MEFHVCSSELCRKNLTTDNVMFRFLFGNPQTSLSTVFKGTFSFFFLESSSSENYSLFFVYSLLLCQAILDVVVNLQFSLIEKLWQTFWRYSPPDSVEGATVTENR